MRTLRFLVGEEEMEEKVLVPQHNHRNFQQIRAFILRGTHRSFDQTPETPPKTLKTLSKTGRTYQKTAATPSTIIQTQHLNSLFHKKQIRRMAYAGQSEPDSRTDRKISKERGANDQLKATMDAKLDLTIGQAKTTTPYHTQNSSLSEKSS